MMYGEHFKIAVYARPSRCKDSRCNTRRLRIPDVENVPCEKPLKLPYWFQHSSVEKHQILNITLFALDDVIFRIEVQILHGVRLPWVPPLVVASFLDSFSLLHLGPSRLPWTSCRRQAHFRAKPGLSYPVLSC